MLSWKATARLVAAVALVLISFVLYAQQPANAAKFCAEMRGSTATGHANCSFASLAECRKHVRAGGGGHCFKLRH